MTSKAKKASVKPVKRKALKAVSGGKSNLTSTHNKTHDALVANIRG
jgi:hypothetical protein